MIDTAKFEQAMDLINKQLQIKQDPYLMIQKSKVFREIGDIQEAMKIANLVIDLALGQDSVDLVIDGKLQKIYCHWQLYQNDLGLDLCEEVIEELQNQEREDNQHISKLAKAYHLRGNLYGSIGNYSGAIDNQNESLILYEKLQDNKNIALMLNNLGFINSLIGDLNEAEEFLSKSLKMFKEIKNPQEIARTKNNLGILSYQRGKYDISEKYLIEALEIQKEIHNPIEMSYSYLELVRLSLMQNDHENALIYYGKLNLLRSDISHDIINLRAKLCHALLLKSQKRYRSKVEAAFILEEILLEDVLHHMYSLTALKHLAEIKLEELAYFEEEEILIELEDLVLQMQEAGQMQRSILATTESDLLLSKLYLIKGDLDSSRELLASAQQVAEKNGLYYLAMNISNLYDHLLEKLPLWEDRAIQDISFKERISQAEIFSFLSNLQYNKLDIGKVSKEKPVMFLVLTEGGIIKGSIIFEKSVGVSEDLFGSFISEINSFISNTSLVHHDIERIKSKDYTILIKEEHGLTYCYICKGQSYYAISKLKVVLDKISKLPSYQKLLQKWEQSTSLEIKFPKSIRDLIKNTFLQDISY